MLSSFEAAFSKVPSFEDLSSLQREVRAMTPIRAIVVEGSVNLYVVTANEGALYVLGSSDEAGRSVKTTVQGGTLYVELERQPPFVVFTRTGSISFGPARGEVFIDGQKVETTRPEAGRTAVCVAIPDLRALTLQGSGDAMVLDLKQAELSIEIKGSGAVTVGGHVERLEADVVGSGEVDARYLAASFGVLSVTGSGEIVAKVTGEVSAEVTGSGEIEVLGDPQRRSERVTGRGQVIFR